VSFDVIYGEARSRQIGMDLAAGLRDVVTRGTMYLGYPVLATADDRVDVDALLVSQDHGFVAFQFAGVSPTSKQEWREIVDSQDRLFGVLDSHLRRHDGLRRGRQLTVQVETVTVFPTEVIPPDGVADGRYLGADEVADFVTGLPPIEPQVYQALQAALQRVSTIKPVKRRGNVQNRTSRGAILKEIEKGIANLDEWQKRAAIESPEGPQRIRGLAGSGKTIVLALKAAYLHAQHPDWRIAVTFESRALYQQIVDLVTRFSFEHSNDAPDFERLQIMHAWGSSSRNGVYTSIARAMNAGVRDFNYASSTYGRDGAFQGICRELLEVASQSHDRPIFDAVLIDEAQDLPPEFFRLVYRFTTDPKRIVWAYDELQKLSESAMPSIEELFGATESGASQVSLVNQEGAARRDIVLPTCYRNSPWSLATAHALGLGIYRRDGLVQHFDDPSLWTEIGYEVTGGRLASGEEVKLHRARVSYPEYFPTLLTPDDAVVLQEFGSEAEQDSWIATQIQRNLGEDELEHDDILIVLPDAFTSKRRAARLMGILAQAGIPSHHVGVSTSVDRVFVRGSVAIAHIYRAKGNEAPMVYVVDSQYAVSDYHAVTHRNTLFTAITRSRAWVRICGWGGSMAEVASEVDAVRTRDYSLEFKIPTTQQLTRMRRIHRERDAADAATLQKATQSIEQLLEALNRNQIDVEEIPPHLRTQLLTRLSQDIEDEADQ
jgi:superfamily I DNA and RNA helicase